MLVLALLVIPVVLGHAEEGAVLCRGELALRDADEGEGAVDDEAVLASRAHGHVGAKLERAHVLLFGVDSHRPKLGRHDELAGALVAEHVRVDRMRMLFTLEGPCKPLVRRDIGVGRQRCEQRLLRSHPVRGRDREVGAHVVGNVVLGAKPAQECDRLARASLL